MSSLDDLLSIHTNEIEGIWPRVEPLITKGLRSEAAVIDATRIRTELLEKERQLWVCVNGKEIEAIILTHALTEYGYKIGVLWLAAGENFRNWAHHADLIADWFQSIGCQKMIIHGRKGWKKFLPSFRADKILYEREL